MVGGPWLRVLEQFAVEALLRSRTFHRAVEKVAKNVHRIRHGLPHEEDGGTNIDDPARAGLRQHFVDEVKGQLTRAQQREAMRKKLDGAGPDAARTFEVEEAEGADAIWRNMQRKAERNAAKTKGKTAEEEEADAEAAWRALQQNPGHTPKAGFWSQYVDALRGQIRNKR
jgi:hypothetical protein